MMIDLAHLPQLVFPETLCFNRDVERLVYILFHLISTKLHSNKISKNQAKFSYWKITSMLTVCVYFWAGAQEKTELPRPAALAPEASV